MASSRLPTSTRRLRTARSCQTTTFTVPHSSSSVTKVTPLAVGGRCRMITNPAARTVLKLATGFAIQNLVPLKTGFWGNEFGYAELLLRPQPDGNPTDWLLKDAVNESDRTWRLSLKEGITFQNGNPLGADQLAAL